MIRSGFIVPVLAVSACGGGYSPNMALLASGPSPQFDGIALQAAANNQDQVLLQISRMAGIPEPERGPRDPDQWAQFGAAAFGRARIECNAYITEIMKVEEHRRTINQQLSLAGAATAGILGVTGVAGTAIAITAMAFGLAQATVDNVTTGMLYSLGAEPVQTLVAKLRVAYTSKLTRASWTDRATSFNLIYGYLELCTPAVLREKIKSAIVKAQPEATGIDSMGGPPQVTILDARPQVVTLESARVPIPAPPQPPQISNLAVSERGMTPVEISDIQLALCVKPDGDPGAPGSNSNTRAAIRNYLSALSGKDPSTMSDLMLAGAGTSFVRDAVAKARSGGVVRSCADRGYLNSYEVGLFEALPSDSLPALVKSIQIDINKKLTPPNAKIVEDGKLETMRDGIAALRKQVKPTDISRAMDQQFFQFVSN